jgi:hypothetical protein
LPYKNCAIPNKKSFKKNILTPLNSRKMNQSKFSRNLRVNFLNATLFLKGQQKRREQRKRRRKTRKMIKTSRLKDRTSLMRS